MRKSSPFCFLCSKKRRIVLKEDTIAAIASPVAEGGIGIIRMSGELSSDILEKVFHPLGKNISFPLENRRLSYGRILDPENGQIIDEVLAVMMYAPHTYTREDVAEIYCHGSVVALRKTLALLWRSGARPAEPGEFTKRAFLNGRLDLSQAEAVMDLIQAKTDTGFDAAMSQLEGALSGKVQEIRKDLTDVLVNVTVNIDYPDEDIEEIVYSDLIKSLSLIDDKIEKLLAGANTGRIVREGIHIAIIGKPNVGKSSLMNALLKEGRAIVTEIPGTTRDTIEESLRIRDIPVVLTDTAGIRETEDTIEQIGIERSREAAGRSDLVILMMDGSVPLSEEDRLLIAGLSGRTVLAVLNKRDQGSAVSEEEIRKLLPQAVIAEASVRCGDGISEIEDAVENLVYQGGVRPGESLLVTNARHEDILRRASILLSDAVSSAKAEEPLDIVEIDIHEAYTILGEIIGEAVSDDIIDEVFARFCLGK